MGPSLNQNLMQSLNQNLMQSLNQNLMQSMGHRHTLIQHQNRTQSQSQMPTRSLNQSLSPTQSLNHTRTQSLSLNRTKNPSILRMQPRACAPIPISPLLLTQPTAKSIISAPMGSLMSTAATRAPCGTRPFRTVTTKQTWNVRL